MNSDVADHSRVNKEWERFLNGDEGLLKFERAMFGSLPSSPRCSLCYAPFEGPFKWLLKLMAKDPWRRNPNICRFCGNWLSKKGPGGAQIELTLLFADIRGSTSLAERLPSNEYVRLINQFFTSATESFVKNGGIIDQLVGDEAIGLFIPGFIGDGHVDAAYRSALQLLESTGHGQDREPRIPVGIGIHTGSAYVGCVGSAENFTEFTAVGNSMNTTARLTSKAAAGNIVMSKAAVQKSNVDTSKMRLDSFSLKGKEDSIPVYITEV